MEKNQNIFDIKCSKEKVLSTCVMCPLLMLLFECQALQTTPWVEEAGRTEKEAATQTEEREEEEEEEKRGNYVRKEREERDIGVQVEETDPELFNFDQEVR